MSNPTPPPAPTTVTLTVKPNGPVIVVGPVTVIDPTGKQVPVTPGKPLALCRCGASTMKPWCDGAHARAAFHAADEAPPR